MARVLALCFAVILGSAVLVACGGDSSSPSATQSPVGTLDALIDMPTLTNASYPTPYPGVVGVISDFLVVEGTEFYPAIPPCTAYQATDAYDVDVPIQLDFLPEGAVQEEAYVSTCPDGTIYGAGYAFALPDARSLSISYARASTSYPVVLGDPDLMRIEAPVIKGRKGLLMVPEGRRDRYAIASLLFWVADQYDTQKAGAYVRVGIVDAETPSDEVATLLIAIADGITVGASY